MNLTALALRVIIYAQKQTAADKRQKVRNKTMKNLTDEQTAMLNELMNTKGFVGKKELAYIIWANTTEPKFHRGNCFVVSDLSYRVLGITARDFKAKVTSISRGGGCLNGNPHYTYTLNAIVIRGGKEVVATFYKNEDELENAPMCYDNSNVFEGEVPDGTPVESVEV